MKPRIYKFLFVSFLFFLALAIALTLSNKIYKSIYGYGDSYKPIYGSYGINKDDVIKVSQISLLNFFKTNIVDRPQPEVATMHINMNFKNHTKFLNRKEKFRGASSSVGDKKFKATLSAISIF